MSLEMPTEEQLKWFHQVETLNEAMEIAVDMILDPQCDFDVWNYLTTGIEEAINARRDGVNK